MKFITFAKLTTITLLTCFSTEQALAAQDGRGGDMVVCAGEPAVVLDYYEAASPGPGDRRLIQTAGLSDHEVAQILKARIQNTVLGLFVPTVVHTVRDLGEWVVAASLEEFDDHGRLYPLPAHCRLKKAAIRRNGDIYISQEALRLLSPEQLGVLYAHELLYAIADVKFGQDDSQKTRIILRQLLKQNLDPVAVADAIRTLTPMAYPFQYLEQQSAVSEFSCRPSPLSGPHEFKIYSPRYDALVNIFSFSFTHLRDTSWHWAPVALTCDSAGADCSGGTATARSYGGVAHTLQNIRFKYSGITASFEVSYELRSNLPNASNQRLSCLIPIRVR